MIQSVQSAQSAWCTSPTYIYYKGRSRERVVQGSTQVLSLTYRLHGHSMYRISIQAHALITSLNGKERAFALSQLMSVSRSPCDLILSDTGRDHDRPVTEVAASTIVDRLCVVAIGPAVRLHIDVAATNRAFENIAYVSLSRPCLSHSYSSSAPRGRSYRRRTYCVMRRVQLSDWAETLYQGGRRSCVAACGGPLVPGYPATTKHKVGAPASAPR